MPTTYCEYRVRYGDTLTGIAQRIYGNPKVGILIYQANRHYIDNPNMLYPGQMIVLPYVDLDNTVFE